MSEHDFILYLDGVPAERDPEAAAAFARALPDGRYGRDASRPYLEFQRRVAPDLGRAARAAAAEVARAWPTAHVVQIVPGAASAFAE